MRRFGIGAIVLVTALVTAALTSLFWILAYNIASDGPAAQDSPDPPPQAAPEAQAEIVLGPGGLAVPVAGVAVTELVDTYTQSRAGGARSHDAIDIMAPRGTPVVAAADGRVEKIFFSEGGGGNTVYIRSPDGLWIYYYAHLHGYAPGLSEGQQVRRGDRLGTVGSSGNADPSGPHLHFAVHRVAPGEDWHEGSPVNPYPLLAGTGRPG